MNMHRTAGIRIERAAIFVVLFAALAFAYAPAAYAGGAGAGGDAREGTQQDVLDASKDSALSEAFQANLQRSLALKELQLDGIARSLAQQALQKMTSEVMKWMTGGMGGSPAFVQNLEEHLKQTADRAAGEFIAGGNLGNVCAATRPLLQATLATQHGNSSNGGGGGSQGTTTQCAIDEISGGNSTAFLAGDFSQGGWAAYFELMIGTGNDPIKTTLEQNVAMNTRILDRQLTEMEELRYGDGYFSQKVCQEIETATGFPKQRCQITKPGALIRDTLSYFVGELPAQQLLNVDELNEVFSGLATGLTNQVLQGALGLLGLNQPGGGGNGMSYLDALAGDKLPVGQSISQNVIDEAVEGQRGYAGIYEDVLDTIDAFETAIASSTSEYPECFDIVALPDELEEDKEVAENNVRISDLVLENLLELQAEFKAANTPEKQLAAYQKYLALDRNGLLKRKADVERLRREYYEDEFLPRAGEFRDRLEAEISRCESSNGSGTNSGTSV